MTTKQIRSLQKEFLRRCMSTTHTLDEIFEDLNIPYETFVNWMEQREFKSWLHGMCRFIKKARELQLQIASYRAAGVISQNASPGKDSSAEPKSRAALIEIIRLARDSKVRRKNMEPDEVLKDSLRPHPDLPQEQVEDLLRELDAAVLPKAKPSDPQTT